MKLWVLTPIDRLAGPWVPWYDKAFGFVVQAETEKEARNIAHDNAGDENFNGAPWLDSTFSSCLILQADITGPATVIMKDFAAA